ncbi:MAG TPA: bifunctional nuclease domain-containing protein [Myxococcota bacterium]
MLGALLLVATASVAANPAGNPAPIGATGVPREPVVIPVASSSRPPTGFLEMFVATVMPTDDGHTVVLVSPTEELLLPVGVALPEAVTIYGRLEHKRAPRPLTHDVLDSLVAALGGTITKVQIDDLVDGAFVGRVFVRTKTGADVPVDARAADALAMALSAKAPIFVARPVVDRAALTHDDLEKMPSRAPSGDAEVAGTGRTFDL